LNAPQYATLFARFRYPKIHFDKGGLLWARPGKTVFDAQVFVAKVGAGKTILEFQKNQNVFTQGDVADTVFTFKKATSR
jgi:hypothetical protein